MRLQELAKILDLSELSPETQDADADTGSPEAEAYLGPEITRGYTSDLLSDVLAKAPAGGVLVTLQVHLNVIAVAGHAGLVAVIFSSGRKPEDDVITRAAEEGVILFSSKADSFDLSGRLYELGIRGSDA